LKNKAKHKKIKIYNENDVDDNILRVAHRGLELCALAYLADAALEQSLAMDGCGHRPRLFPHDVSRLFGGYRKDAARYGDRIL